MKLRAWIVLGVTLSVACDRRAPSSSPSSSSSTPSSSSSPSASTSSTSSSTIARQLDALESDLLAAASSSAAPSSSLAPPAWFLAPSFDPPRPTASEDLKPTRWKLTTCHRRFVMGAATMPSAIVVDLLLDEGGAVVKAAIVRDGGDRALTTCMLAALKSTAFAQPEGASPKLRVTWTPKP